MGVCSCCYHLDWRGGECLVDVRIPSSSVVLYRHRVSAAADPISNLVSMAVVPYDEEPEAADFKTAAWITEGGAYYAVALVGQVGTGIGALTEGIYRSWVKITATPEIPVLPSTNYLVIT
jgi:hypothetical protein